MPGRLDNGTGHRLEIQASGARWDRTPASEVDSAENFGWYTYAIYPLNGEHDEQIIHVALTWLLGEIRNADRSAQSSLTHAYWRLVLFIPKGEVLRTSDGGMVNLSGEEGEEMVVLLGPLRQGEDYGSFGELLIQHQSKKNGRFRLPFNVPRDYGIGVVDREAAPTRGLSGREYPPGEEVPEEERTASVRSTVRDAEGNVVSDEVYDSSVLTPMKPGDALVIEGSDGSVLTFEVLGSDA